MFAGKTDRETASFLVVLREQADLRGADLFPGKAEKGRFVLEALRAQAERSQAPLRRRLDATGASYRSFYLVNMIEVEGDRAIAEELAGRDDVSSISPNPEIPLERGPVPEPQPGASPYASRLTPYDTLAVEPNIAKIRAPAVWAQGFTGQGIVVAIADTGTVAEHSALKSHYRGTSGSSVTHDYNWHDAIHNAGATNPCGSDSVAPCDDDGHGTATASLAVGDDGAGNQVGVAPGARFIACRNMDRGAGTPARYTECFQFFLAPTDRNGANPRPDLAPHVINNSWGCPVSEGCLASDPNILRAVIENVRAAGILVVVSAGNGGPLCSTISDVPGFYDAAFSVGATVSTDLNTSVDAIASFSSRGPITADGSNRLKPDISAPGVALRVAAIPTGFRSGFSGTSGSGPEVAGAAALLLSAAPQLSGQPVATADLLRRSAVPLTSTQDCGGFPGSAVPNPIFGSGRLDIAAAVLLAMPTAARTRPVLSPRRGGPRALAPRS